MLSKQIHEVFCGEEIAITFCADTLDSLLTPLLVLEDFIEAKHVVASQNTEPPRANLGQPRYPFSILGVYQGVCCCFTRRQLAMHLLNVALLGYLLEHYLRTTLSGCYSM